jgi:hypothetical protein
MTTPSKLLILAATLALAGLIWLWQPPRSASDCAPSDRDCLRKVAEHLIAESLELNQTASVVPQVEAMGRLLATEGTIDLATQHNRLTAIGFHHPPAVFDSYFDALTDPSYPFDLVGAIAAKTGPEGTDLEDYLIAAFRLGLPDPDRRADVLAGWQQNYDTLSDPRVASGTANFFILAWLARNEPDLAAQYFQLGADSRSYMEGPGGWLAFFRIAAWHCREGRRDEGRRLLDGLATYFDPNWHIAVHVPALLDCAGERVAVAAVEDSLSSRAAWVAEVLARNPNDTGFVVSELDELSTDLRRHFADWFLGNGRGAEVAAYWSRYGAAEIARRHLPRFGWLPDRLAENQSAPPQDQFFPDLASEVLDRRLAFWVTDEAPFSRPPDYDHPSPYRDIAEEWPSPLAITAAKGLLQRSEGLPFVAAFIVGLERQLGCAPSEATLQRLLADISALKDPLDQASAIIELLRFTPTTPAPDAPTGHACLIE